MTATLNAAPARDAERGSMPRRQRDGTFDLRALPAWVYLVAGALALPLASLKWNVAPLAWVAPVPFLLYAQRHSSRWSQRWWLLAALIVGCNLMTFKLLSYPTPWMMVPGYGVPIALALWIVYLTWGAIRARAGERWALYVFPSLMALTEVASYRLSEFGVWGAAANTQVDDLRLLQFASVAGVGGIGFVMAWFASMVATYATSAERRPLRPHLGALVGAILAIYGYGSIRLHAELPGASVNVAGIIADLGPTPAGLPDGDAVRRNTDELFQRSELAANRGARLVVWNEAATVVQASEESLFVRRGIELARRRNIDLVLAYIIPVANASYRMENKYVWLSSEGTVLETYYKHHPVPGEGSLKGDAPLRLIQRPFGDFAGAICYDYDFPAMSLAHSRLGAGVVVIPSSDWRGIDPYHTQMARIRAIEGGFSVLRPVRWATSGAFDAYGRSRAALSHFEENERVILATLPVAQVPTVYARIGDAPAFLYALILVGALAGARRRSSPSPG